MSVGRSPPDQALPHQYVGLADRADGAGANQLDDPAVIVGGVDLRAHLRGDLGLGGELRDGAGLVDGVRERLLAVHVLLHPQGQGRGRRVGVVGRADDHGVDVAASMSLRKSS